jgi:hypothetical protein
LVLDDVVRTLCDEKISPYQRAITLFEFQVAILSPAQPRHVSCARALAAVKILEYLERDMPTNPNLEQRLANVEYRRVLEVLLQESGASVLRSLISSRKLKEDIEVRMSESKDIAHLVKFSHRFAKFGKPSSQQKGGVTMARNFLVNTKYPLSDGTLKSRWKEYKSTAVLQYLLHDPSHKNLKPKRVSGKKFVELLITQANDVGSIRKFFSDYLHLRPILGPRGYQFEEIAIDRFPTVSKSVFVLEPFSHAELEAISS